MPKIKVTVGCEIKSFDEILPALEEACIFEIRIKEGKAVIWESCDYNYSEELTAQNLRDLAKEIEIVADAIDKIDN